MGKGSNTGTYNNRTYKKLKTKRMKNGTRNKGPQMEHKK